MPGKPDAICSVLVGILVLGPDSSLAAVILGVVLAHSGGDPGRAVALAGTMAVVSGIVCILAGVARLGFVTELLSKPIRYGYMNGIALTVLISQFPNFSASPSRTTALCENFGPSGARFSAVRRIGLRFPSAEFYALVVSAFQSAADAALAAQAHTKQSERKLLSAMANLKQEFGLTDRYQVEAWRPGRE
jgi:MFS superfamily sulfate permease-like transporter